MLDWRFFGVGLFGSSSVKTGAMPVGLRVRKIIGSSRLLFFGAVLCLVKFFWDSCNERKNFRSEN